MCQAMPVDLQDPCRGFDSVCVFAIDRKIRSAIGDEADAQLASRNRHHLRVGKGTACVAADIVKKGRDIANRPADGKLTGYATEVIAEAWTRRHQSPAGLQADQTATGRGYANRAARIGGMGNRNDAGSNGCSRAAGRAT
jgi:hypothetical protein